MTTNETSSVFRNYSQEMKRLLARSKLINEYYEKDFDISFSSIFLAFLANDDPISQWFSGYVKVGGIDVQRILEERNVNQQIIDDISSRTILPYLLHASHRLTTSAMKYLSLANQFREIIAEGDQIYPLDIHHLMAVFIYKPWVHEKDLIRWGFDRVKWSDEFLNQIRLLYPDELEFWKMQHIKTFNLNPEVKQ
jgi:hypothetical protein